MDLKKITSIILLFSFVVVHSQKHKKPEESVIELAKKLKIEYPDEELVIEKSNLNVDFSLKRDNVSATLESYEKLINIDSKTYSNRHVFYNGESTIKNFDISFSNNHSANFTINDVAYEDNDLFHTDTRLKYVELDFPLQGFEYQVYIDKIFSDIKYFTTIYFNDDYPIKEKEIKIVVPNWLNIKFQEFNFEGYEIESQVEKEDENTIYTYKAFNLPSMFKEKNSRGPSYLYPHIMILPISYTDKGEEEKIFATLKDQYQWYKNLVDKLDYTNKPYVSKVEELTKDLTSKEEKIKKIFYWIQDNIRYIAFEDGIAGFQPENASEVFSKRYGDCKGMANLAKAMLSEIGVDARLTWIGTNHIAYDYSTPNLAVDNHMICTIMDSDIPIFLDPTEKFNPYKEFANRIQGKQALIEDGENFKLKTVPVSKAEESIEKKEYYLKIVDDVLVGKANNHYSGESRKQILAFLNSLQTHQKEDFLTSFLEQGSSLMQVNNIESSDLKNREQDINIDYDLLVEGKVSSFGDKTYIDIRFNDNFSDLLMEDRKSDFVFSHKKIIESKAYIDISGFKTSKIMEPIHFETKNFKIDISVEKVDQSLICTQKIQILNEVITKEELPDWNTKIKTINNFLNQQIILQKA